MKKTYIKPTSKVIAISTTGMLATSATGTSISNIEAPSDALSRETDFWGDEDY